MKDNVNVAQLEHAVQQTIPCFLTHSNGMRVQMGFNRTQYSALKINSTQQSPARTADCPRICGYPQCGLSADIRKHSVADAVRLLIVSCGCGADADPVV